MRNGVVVVVQESFLEWDVRMSVLTVASLNIMSETTQNDKKASAAASKDKISEKCTVGENKVPPLAPRIKGTRSFSPPFPRAVYNCFLDSLKIGESAYPGSKELRILGFHCGTRKSPRQRFRAILPRLDFKTVDGSLVFSANPKQDVLISKRSRKIILPEEDVEKAVKRAHLTGCNRTSATISNETKQKHGSVTKTMAVLVKDFTISRREFGINRMIVKRVVDRCPSCALAEISSDEDGMLSVPSEDWEQPCGIAEKSGGVSKSNMTQSASLESMSCFASMVAHVPDKVCIWYGRQCIASTTNKFAKLLLVMNEIRGEMALAIKGNAGAKQRLETKLYCGQLLIRDYLKIVQQSLNGADEDSQIMTSHLLRLQQEYTEAGQARIFRSDLQNVVESAKNNKLALPVMLVKQIEDFLNEQNDCIKHTEEES